MFGALDCVWPTPWTPRIRRDLDILCSPFGQGEAPECSPLAATELGWPPASASAATTTPAAATTPAAPATPASPPPLPRVLRYVNKPCPDVPDGGRRSRRQFFEAVPVWEPAVSEPRPPQVPVAAALSPPIPMAPEPLSDGERSPNKRQRRAGGDQDASASAIRILGVGELRLQPRGRCKSDAGRRKREYFLYGDTKNDDPALDPVAKAVNRALMRQYRDGGSGSGSSSPPAGSGSASKLPPPSLLLPLEGELKQ
eukprot:m51a1_g8172 hypothetical protein (255) ;mRNA; r:108783-110783